MCLHILKYVTGQLDLHAVWLYCIDVNAGTKDAGITGQED